MGLPDRKRVEEHMRRERIKGHPMDEKAPLHRALESIMNREITADELPEWAREWEKDFVAGLLPEFETDPDDD